jgi:hypothetical protein
LPTDAACPFRFVLHGMGGGEQGTMDDATAGEGLKVLRSEIAQLTARADELADTMAGEPAPPPPGTIERLQAYLRWSRWRRRHQARARHCHYQRRRSRQ